MKKIIYFLMFLAITIAALCLSLLKMQFFVKAGLAGAAVILALILFRVNKKLFVPALFFCLVAVFNPVYAITGFYKLKIPQIYLLIPIILYLAIVLNVKDFRKEICWLKWGEFNRETAVLTGVLIVSSVAGLSLWAFLIEKDFSRFKEFIPRAPFILLALYGILFPVFNAVFEEFMARAVMFDGLGAIFSGKAPVVVWQAAVFALWHFKGFPGGMAGIVMVFVWSIFLGIIRCTSRGMLAPLVAHFFADLTIEILLFFIIILPEKMIY